MIKRLKILFSIFVLSLCFKVVNADVKLTESNLTILLDWSYDGTKILFATSKNSNFLNLATISPDGTNETQITTEEGGIIVEGRFLPDGTIYFWQKTATDIKLGRMNSDGSGKTTLLTIPGDYDIDDWSVSTTTAKIAYIREDHSSGEKTLWVVNFDGTNNTQLANAYLIGGWEGIDFSPDGQWIVFNSTEDYIYKIKIDNTGLTQLTTSQFYTEGLKWSSDGTKIAFGSGGDIYTINSDGTGLTNLTGDDDVRDDSPRWAPDGTKILWRRNGKLWIMNSDGSNKLQLSDINIGFDIPVQFIWKKDNNKIAFCNSQNIYTINPDGTDQQKITNNLNPIINGIWGEGRSGLSWSGDYNKIAYVRYFTDPQEEVKLTIMNKDGSNKYDLISSTYGWINSVSFAPHTTKILYEKDIHEEDNEINKIYTINSDGTGETYLADGVAPKWSPDTTRIAFSTAGYLYVMNSDGSNKQSLTQHYRWEGINWSSDSTKIVYVYDHNIWIIPATGGTPQKITNYVQGDYSYPSLPVFSPDNSKIAYCLEKHQLYGEPDEPDELWVINSDGNDATKLVDLVSDSCFVPIKWAKNDRIYFVKRGEGLYSIKPDGTDLKQENQIFTWVGNFDVSPTGDIIYGGIDVFTTQPVASGYITGKVTKSDGKTGISGVTIRVTKDGNLRAQTTTDANGNYNVYIATGTYSVIASVETGGGNSYQISYSTITDVTVYKDQTTSNINFSFEYTGNCWHSISSTEGDLFSEGMREPNSPWINYPITIYLGNRFTTENITSAVVYYKKSDEINWSTSDFVFYSSGTTDQYLDNNYWKAIIQQQNSPTTIQYYIKVIYTTHEPTFVYGDNTHSWTTVHEDQAKSKPFSFDVVGLGGISGKVTNKNNVGIEGVTVYVWTYDPPHVIISSATTNENGAYIIDGLPEGKYRVGISGAWQRGYVDRHYNDKPDRYSADPVYVQAGKITENINFILPQTGRISGNVRDQYGNGLEGVIVEAIEKNWNSWARPRDPQTGEWVTTSSTGYYQIVGLLPGKYKVRIQFDKEGVKPIYYNNATEWKQANEIEITEGQEVGGIDFTITTDTTPPSITLKINNGEQSTNFRITTLTVVAVDDFSGVDSVRFSNDNQNWTDWKPYSTSGNEMIQQFQLTEGAGTKTVYAQARDKMGNVSESVSATIELNPETVQPPVNITAGTNDWWGGVQQASLDKNTGEVTFNILSLRNPPPITYTVLFGYEPDKVELILPNGKRISYKQKYQVSGSTWNYVFEVSPKDITENVTEITPALGQLQVSLEITEGSQTFIQELGKITLHDPSGYVYNISNNELIPGATVTLYRFNIGTGEFEVADPNVVGMDPRINPQITDINGRYGWNVEAGRYYVKVEAPWYETTISTIVIVPPEVTDLNVGLKPTDTTPPTGSVVIQEGSFIESPIVTLNISISDMESGVRGMRVSDKSDFSGAQWEVYTSTKQFVFDSNKGQKTVYVQFKDKNGNISMASDITALVAQSLANAHPYPNPFKPNSGLGHTNITFTELPQKVRIRIFNLAGELVYDTEEITTDGTYSWNAVNQRNESLASGIYIYLITNKNDKKTGKLVIVR